MQNALAHYYLVNNSPNTLIKAYPKYYINKEGFSLSKLALSTTNHIL